MHYVRGNLNSKQIYRTNGTHRVQQCTKANYSKYIRGKVIYVDPFAI